MLVQTKEILEKAIADFVDGQLKNEQISPEMVASISELIKSIA